MKFMKSAAVACAAVLLAGGAAVAKPTIHPVGTLRYNPEKAWNSFVILSNEGGSAKLIDRNGNLVHEWDLKGGQGMPNKVYPGGYLLTSLYPTLSTGFQDNNMVALLDFDGNIVRKFNRHEQLSAGEPGQPAEPDGTYWASRQHHDYQLEGSTTGYYAPGLKVKQNGKMLVLTHENVVNRKINDNMLLDDVILIVDKNENIVWKWHAADHFDEFGFTDEALAQTRSKTLPPRVKEHQGIDWFHINCASWLGPNKWYDAGDKRFHPDNIIADSRNTSHMFIIDHKTGKIVWQAAPPFVGADAQLKPLDGIHHTHMIPKGLPGAGNIMVFDNGGTDLTYPTQNHNWSRVVEYNPVTKEKVWEYSSTTAKMGMNSMFGDDSFFSPFISSAQRLPNGNTLICEGSTSRIIEVTPDHELVWEYVNPYNHVDYMNHDYTYRAYAVPYEWVPQLGKPMETAVVPPANEQILVPDVNGKLPNYKPVVDKRPSVQFGEPAPIRIPGQK